MIADKHQVEREERAQPQHYHQAQVPCGVDSPLHQVVGDGRDPGTAFEEIVQRR